MFAIKNLSFSYPEQKNKVLNDISLTIHAGDFIVLCGRSGCGKTTLLQHMMPSLVPIGDVSGEVLYHGKTMKQLTQEEMKVGYVFQNPDDQIVMDKVFHELAFGLENMGMYIKTMKRRIGEIVHYFHLQEILETSTHVLSGGQKQMVNLASIMAMNPDVILLDEALTQLDPVYTKSFMAMLKAINEEFGITIVLVEHQLEEVLPIATRMIFMDQGKIVKDDSCINVIKTMMDLHVFEEAIPDYCKLYKQTKKLPMNIAEGRLLANKLIPKRNKETVEKTEILCTVKNLSFTYDTWLLKDIALDIYHEDFLTIVGSNGCGKSTLLKCLVGILKHHATIHYPQAHVLKWGYVPQDPTTLFIKDRVMLELTSMTSNQDKVKEIVQIMELEGVVDLHPYDLSGGQKQLLAIAKVLLLEPDILVLDEPTKGMDGTTKQNVGRVLQRLNTSMAIICVSHDLEFSAVYSKRVGMLFNGQLETIDTTRAFFTNNLFYTTTMHKIMREYDEKVITYGDLEL